jgi:hypothetical protein
MLAALRRALIYFFHPKSRSLLYEALVKGTLILYFAIFFVDVELLCSRESVEICI